MADVLSVIADILKQDKQQKREHARMMREVQKKLKEKDSEEVAEEEIREARKLELSDGYSDAELESLIENEIVTIENLADLATDELTEILEIDDDKAAKFIMSARQEWLKD